MYINILNTQIISADHRFYDGWPTVTRLNNGLLCLAYSGGRQRHICPFGRLELMQSNDNGKTWTWPRVILDTALDDRDGGIMQTPKGSLLMTTFSSDAYQYLFSHAEELEKQGKINWSENELSKWVQAHNRIICSPESQMGQWVLRSTDCGSTWSKPIPSIVNSPHGPIALKSGRILYPGKELWQGQGRVGFCVSDDDGQSWDWLTELPIRAGDTAQHYHELHAVEANNGSIIVHIRNWNENNQGETLQSESTDEGKTWTTPHSIGVWGLPSHLLKLSDGRLMMTYGHRLKPFGNQARLSDDHGQSWSSPLLISVDGTCSDLGYPSTVELAPNHFLSIWYERKNDEKRAVLRQSEWEIIRG